MPQAPQQKSEPEHKPELQPEELQLLLTASQKKQKKKTSKKNEKNESTSAVSAESSALATRVVEPEPQPKLELEPLPAESAATTALRAELTGMKLRALFKRAEALGLPEEQVEEAEESADPKQAVIELIMLAAAAAPAVLSLRDQVLATATADGGTVGSSDGGVDGGDGGVVAPPDEFLCPISCDIMEEPVATLLAGNTYEKTHIMAWFRTHQTDPLTNTKLSSKRLVPNNSLRSQIHAWTH
jgi:hypothetical protein